MAHAFGQWSFSGGTQHLGGLLTRFRRSAKVAEFANDEIIAQRHDVGEEDEFLTAFEGRLVFGNDQSVAAAQAA